MASLNSNSIQMPQQLLRDKAWARWVTALVLLASAMFFAYIFVDVLSPLQEYLQSTKGWEPQAYGRFAGSETFLNVFVFFLIFAKHHSRQDGSAFHGNPFRSGNGGRKLHQLLCADRLVCRKLNGAFHGQFRQSSRRMVERHSFL